jgi:excisionase family DNA binding protein
MPNEPEILTPLEAAEFLRVPLLTVQRQAKAGRLPGRRIGKEWRFSRTVLIEWMASGPDRHDLELYNRRVDPDDGDSDQAEPSEEQDSA